MIEKALQTSRSEVGERGTTGARTETPLHPWRGPCQSRYPSTPAAGGCSLKEATAHEEPMLERLLTGAVACGGKPVLEEIIWQELQSVGEPCWISPFLKDFTSQRDSH